MVLFPYNIFAYHMGLVELELTLRLEDGSQQMWYTDLLPVLIQPSPQQENLKAMVEFIYAHQGPLLREEGPGTAGPDRDGFQDFLSQLTLAEETLQVYEENYGYFKANCRHTLESAEVVDWTERVQTVSPHTLQYLVRHPEQLILQRRTAHIADQNIHTQAPCFFLYCTRFPPQYQCGKPKGSPFRGAGSRRLTERLYQICSDLSVSAAPSHLPCKGRLFSFLQTTPARDTIGAKGAIG